MSERDFIPPSGVHDATCEFLCKNPSPSCSHACSVCDAKAKKLRTLLPVSPPKKDSL
jgi:hypothetical protein